jgi:hypothetical protein
MPIDPSELTKSLGAIGTLDIYSSVPWDWDDSEMTALQIYAGLVASLLMEVTAGKPLPPATEGAEVRAWSSQLATRIVQAPPADAQ